MVVSFPSIFFYYILRFFGQIRGDKIQMKAIKGLNFTSSNLTEKIFCCVFNVSSGMSLLSIGLGGNRIYWPRPLYQKSPRLKSRIFLPNSLFYEGWRLLFMDIIIDKYPYRGIAKGDEVSLQAFTNKTKSFKMHGISNQHHVSFLFSKGKKKWTVIFKLIMYLPELKFFF